MASQEGLDDWCPEPDVMNKDVLLSTVSPPDTGTLGVPGSDGTRNTHGSGDDIDADDTMYQYDGYDSFGARSDDDDEDDDESSTTTDSDDTSGQEDFSQRRGQTITFRNGTDVNSIPIQKDGMAVCEKCGAIGVKHAFYSKSKRFCSLACSRSYATLQREGKPIPKPKPVFKYPLSKLKVIKKDPVRRQDSPGRSHPLPVVRDLSRSFHWKPYLYQELFVAAPVSCFKHAALSDCWENVTVGMKVEVENRDYDVLKELFPLSYWVASVVKVAGYKVLLRYEGFGMDSSEDFWINLCKDHVQPVGWCASKGKPLIPPRTIQNKYSDWKDFLVKRLTGARTLPNNFHAKVEEGLSSRFKPGIQLEVVDKNRISSMRVAVVDEVLGGRLHLRYKGADEIDEGFWCHERSPLIHPMGWSQVVGHTIQASREYLKRSLQKAVLKNYESNEASWDMFPQTKCPSTTLRFKEGMKLEAIDPLNLSTICVATVTKMLRNNCMMIGIDGYLNEKGSDWFCYHSSSSSIFPVGFCELNGITLTPPRGHKGEFKWFDYLKQTKSVAAPEIPNHGYQVGMRLEAVDLMEPRLICVGTVTKVIGRLLRIHFDGWDESYDQWCDCESPDLYPVGWCEMVHYHLEPPRNMSPPDMSYKQNRKAKTQVYRGPRKKKRRGAIIPAKSKTNGKTGMSYLSMKMSSPKLPSPPKQIKVDSTDLNDADVKKDSQYNAEADMTVTLKNSPAPKSALFTQEPVKSQPCGDQTNVSKTIPRLVDLTCSNQTVPSHQSVITPELWSVFEVSQFLRINDCGAYSENFSKKKIDGRKLLTLTKEQIVNLTGMKVGPSLKIFDLILQLKAKVQVS